MSYKGLFPTRTGTPIGGAAERQMLDRTGVSGYRKDFRTGLDGRVTMLTTKNGMPQFQSFGIAASSIPVTYSDAYLETGRLTWTYPNPLNPTKYDPAKWKFLDIPPSGQYLGYIKNAEVMDAGSDGEQDNYPTLVEDQESHAIGYVKVKLNNRLTPTQISQAAIKDAETKLAAGEDTVMKKLVAGFFPASLFSGKMRLFMQATYGAKTAIGAYPMIVEVVGTSALLMYSAKNTRIQFGFWAHKSPGIFTAPDGTFWLLDIAMHSGAAMVTSYPITPNANVAGLVKRYKSGVFTGDTKTKVESYIFANSTIDLSKPVPVGSYTTSAASGSSIAYGWKFNTEGDTARIVASTQSGDGATAKFTSYTVTLNFTYSGGAVSMNGETVLNGDWIDGWGTFNIFAPDSESSAAPLSHYSVTHGYPRPSLEFPMTEIYGFFKDDLWVPVKISRNELKGPWPIKTQSSSGLRYSPASYENIYPSYQYGFTLATEGYYWEGHEIYSGTTMDLMIGDTTYKGTIHVGTHTYITRTVSPGGTFRNAVSFTALLVGSGIYGDPGTPPGYAFYDGPDGYVVSANATMKTVTFTGTAFAAWTLVIPGYDCEAAFAATRKSIDATTVSETTETDGGGITKFVGPGYSYAPWASVYISGNGWYGSYGPGGTYVNDPAAQPPPEVVKIICYTAALNGIEGTPAHSYLTLFYVDHAYPYYDPGMYSITSYGKRYDISEGLTSHPSMSGQPRVVGWA